MRLPARRSGHWLLTGLLLAVLTACSPSKRETHDVIVGVQNTRLTQAAPQLVTELSLNQDPFYADRQNDLDQISDINLRINVPANSSSRLRIGVYVSAERETRLLETTKIADFNLDANGTTPAEGTLVRIFNESNLRNFVLGDRFFFYLVAEADRVNVDIATAQLIVTAKFLE